MCADVYNRYCARLPATDCLTLDINRNANVYLHYFVSLGRMIIN